MENLLLLWNKSHLVWMWGMSWASQMDPTWPDVLPVNQHIVVVVDVVVVSINTSEDAIVTRTLFALTTSTSWQERPVANIQ